MSIPRNHHFIPAFYLKQWCRSDGKLTEYTIKHQRKLVEKPIGPDATGYQFDLYAFQELPPEQAQFIEQKFFDYADRLAADALELHLSGKNAGWNSELQSAWSRFVIALHCRHPDAMPELRAAAKSLWDGSGVTSQRQYELIRQASDPKTFDEYIAQRDPLLDAKAKVNLIVKVFDNEIVGAHVNNMKWAVVNVSAAPHQLLTSDRPVSLFNIKDAKGMITIPISPTRLFVAVNDPKLLNFIDRRKPGEIVKLVNSQLVSRARRFVWGASSSQSSFIQKYMSTKLEPTPFFPTLGKYPEASSPLQPS